MSGDDSDFDAAIAASIAAASDLNEKRRKQVQEAEDAALALSLSRGNTPAENIRPIYADNRRAQELEDAALALKLSTIDYPKSTPYNDNDNDNDEALARALYETEQAEGKRGAERGAEDIDQDYALALQLQDEQGNSQQPLASSSPKGGGLFDRFVNALKGVNSNSHNDDGCCVCGNITMMRRVRARGRSYCSSCFTCKRCHKQLSGQFYYDDTNDPGGIYCQPCLNDAFGLKCSVCDQCIQGQYLKHNFFDNEKYCLTHDQIEDRRKCGSCHRVEPYERTGKGMFVDLPDARVCCLECLSSAIMTSDAMLALYLSVVDYMETELHLSIPHGMRSVPVLAVDVASLNEQLAGGSTTHGGGGLVRGLTLSRVANVTHYSQGDLSFSYQHGFQVGQPRVLRVDTQREVTAVCVLFGLPRDLTASILAHEAMHVYLKLSARYPLDIQNQAEEGICQVVAHKYLAHLRATNTTSRSTGNGGVGGSAARGLAGRGLGVRTGGFSSPSSSISFHNKHNVHLESEGGDGDANDSIESKLRDYFSYSIEEAPDEIYGGGYRIAAKVVDQLGLDITLDVLAHDKTLPRT